MKFKTVFVLPHNHWLGEGAYGIYAKVYTPRKANDIGGLTQKARCRWRSTGGATPAVSVTKVKPSFDIATHGWDLIVGAGRDLSKEPHVEL